MASFGLAEAARSADIPVGLNHIKLRVKDLDVSVAFYYRLFGGPMAETTGGSYLTPPDLRTVFARIGSGKTYLVLSPPDATVPAGLEHIAMDRPGLLVADAHWIPHAFPLDPGYVRDPDGHLVEFVTSGFWQSAGARQSPTLPASVTAERPVFEPVTIRRIELRSANVTRSVEFYRLFTMGPADPLPHGGRRFDFEGTALDVLPGRQRGLGGFAVTVRRYDEAETRRRLHHLGIPAERQNVLTVRDPDGNRIEIAAQ